MTSITSIDIINAIQATLLGHGITQVQFDLLLLTDCQQFADTLVTKCGALSPAPAPAPAQNAKAQRQRAAPAPLTPEQQAAKVEWEAAGLGWYTKVWNIISDRSDAERLVLTVTQYSTNRNGKSQEHRSIVSLPRTSAKAFANFVHPTRAKTQFYHCFNNVQTINPVLANAVPGIFLVEVVTHHAQAAPAPQAQAPAPAAQAAAPQAPAPQAPAQPPVPAPTPAPTQAAPQ